ncbi:hypothetical protein CRM22_011353 [Opisthorchis felineus]|uniref:Uncharacterized protein n=1 Tax=Opisthorchis felineus TaxID=147828 RepID=A0A4S2JLX9_OPIFE|nr:hypothetical protein CRM22_011353 [Opisthorchis felineus]
MNNILPLLLFNLFRTAKSSGDFHSIYVQLDPERFSVDQSDPCKSLSELNEEYWRRGRFSNCEVLEQEETGVFTLKITVDHDKLRPEHRHLPRDFYLWVLNRQLNLQEIGCATLTGYPGENRGVHFERAKLTFPAKGCICDKLKSQKFENGVRIKKCLLLETSTGSIHTEYIATYDVKFSHPVSRGDAVKLLGELNGGRKRCRFNMVPLSND